MTTQQDDIGAMMMRFGDGCTLRYEPHRDPDERFCLEWPAENSEGVIQSGGHATPAAAIQAALSSNEGILGRCEACGRVIDGTFPYFHDDSGVRWCQKHGS